MKILLLALTFSLLGCSSPMGAESAEDDFERRREEPPLEPGDPYQNRCGGRGAIGTIGYLFSGGERPESGVAFTATVVAPEEGVVVATSEYGSLRFPVPAGEEGRFAVDEELAVVVNFADSLAVVYGDEAQIWVAGGMSSGFIPGFATSLTLPNGAQATVGRVLCRDSGSTSTECGEGSRSSQTSAVVVSHDGEEAEVAEGPVTLGEMVISAAASSQSYGLVECEDGGHYEAGWFETLDVVVVVPSDGTRPPVAPIGPSAYPLCEMGPSFELTPEGFGPRGPLDPSPGRVLRVDSHSATLEVEYRNGLRGAMEFDWSHDGLDAYLAVNDVVSVSREVLADGFVDRIVTPGGEVRLLVDDDWSGVTEVAPGVSALLGVLGCYAALACDDTWGDFSIGVGFSEGTTFAESTGEFVELNDWMARGWVTERTATGTSDSGECTRAPLDERTRSIVVALAR